MATPASSCSRRGCHLPAGTPGGLCGPHDVAEREARLRRLGFTEGQLDALLDAGYDVPFLGAPYAVRTPRRGAPPTPPTAA